MNYSGIDVVQVRLVKDHTLYSDEKISNSNEAMKVITKEIGNYDREVFCVLNLASNGRPINLNIVSIGVLNSTSVSMREVFKGCILSNAAGFIAAHNHPSGSIEPSRDDNTTMERLVKTGHLLGIPMIDSIICAPNTDRYYSFRESGFIEKCERKIWEKENRVHDAR